MTIELTVEELKEMIEPKDLERELKREGYKPYGPFVFSELPKAISRLEGLYGKPIEEIKIIRGERTRGDFYPKHYMIYVLVENQQEVK